MLIETIVIGGIAALIGAAIKKDRRPTYTSNSTPSDWDTYSNDSMGSYEGGYESSYSSDCNCCSSGCDCDCDCDCDG